MALRKLASSQGITLYRNAEWDEYVIRLDNNPETDYHTDDKQDAIKTYELECKKRDH